MQKKLAVLLAVLICSIGGVAMVTWISGEKITTTKLNEMITDEARHSRTVHVLIPSIPQGTDDEIPFFKAPRGLTITAAGVIPEDNFVGAINSFSLKFKNKGSDGSGTNVIAIQTYLAGKDFTAFDYDDFGTLAFNTLAANDTVSFSKEDVLVGAIMPRLIAVIVYQLTE